MENTVKIENCDYRLVTQIRHCEYFMSQLEVFFLLKPVFFLGFF